MTIDTALHKPGHVHGIGLNLNIGKKNIKIPFGHKKELLRGTRSVKTVLSSYFFRSYVSLSCIESNVNGFIFASSAQETGNETLVFSYCYLRMTNFLADAQNSYVYTRYFGKSF